MTLQFTRIVGRMAYLQLAPIALSMIQSKNTHCFLKSFILYFQNKKALKTTSLPNTSCFILKCKRKNQQSNIKFHNNVLTTHTGSPLLIAFPSSPMGGAGNVSQSTNSQKSLDQSALQTLTRRSALAANHNNGDDKGYC